MLSRTQSSSNNKQKRKSQVLQKRQQCPSPILCFQEDGKGNQHGAPNYTLCTMSLSAHDWHLALKTTLWSWHHGSHFTQKETKARRGEVSHSRSHSPWGRSWGPNSACLPGNLLLGLDHTVSLKKKTAWFTAYEKQRKTAYSDKPEKFLYLSKTQIPRPFFSVLLLWSKWMTSM